MKHRHPLPVTARLLALYWLLLALTPHSGALHAAPTMAARIIGGSETTTEQWPWMVALVLRSSPSSYDGQFCGGSLIHPRWVLTAGHCFLDRNDNVDTSIPIDAVIGRTDLTASNGRRIAITRVVVNPDYVPAIDDGDLALVELSEAIEDVTPVTLPGPIYGEFFAIDGTPATVLGWGNTSTTDTHYPERLQQVSMPLIDSATCQATYATRPITDNMLCAGDGLGGRDSCQGDSGGPLVISDLNDHTVQVGLVSFGEGCAREGSYGAYTRISRYAQWISDTLCATGEPPAAPTLTTTTRENTASLSFDRVAGADGYRLYYAPAPTLEPIKQIDLGGETTLSTPLPAGSDLFVAVQPYNGACLGALSGISRITLP